MLAWSEGTDNGRQKTRNHGYDVIVGGELFTDYLITLGKTVAANPKLKSTGAGRYQLFPVGGMPTASSFAWKTSLRKVRTLWHCSRLRSVALYLWLIVVISVSKSTVARLSGLHCRAPVMVSSSIRLTAWLQNSKKRRNGQERLMYEQSHRDYLRLGYLHHRLPVMGWATITVITPLLCQPSATKMPENWSWRTRQLPTCADASAWCYSRCKIHEGVSWC